VFDYRRSQIKRAFIIEKQQLFLFLHAVQQTLDIRSQCLKMKR